MMFPSEYVYIYSLQESTLVWRLFTPFTALWPVRYHWWRGEASALTWSLSPSPREPVQDAGMPGQCMNAFSPVWKSARIRLHLVLLGVGDAQSTYSSVSTLGWRGHMSHRRWQGIRESQMREHFHPHCCSQHCLFDETVVQVMGSFLLTVNLANWK